MKIGIIIYSKTGNTKMVSERIKEKYNDITIEEIKIAGNPEKGMDYFDITNAPKPDYDYIIFASAVNAFTLCPVMVKYLMDIEDLENKKISIFVTQFFPYKFMGGNNAIRKMQKLIENKKGKVRKTGVINFKNKKKDDMITNLVNEFVEDIKIGG